MGEVHEMERVDMRCTITRFLDFTLLFMKQ